MGTLLNKANEILTEKTSKIIPENIKEGVEIFDVTGTMTAQRDWIQFTDPETGDRPSYTINSIATIYDNLLDKTLIKLNVTFDKTYTGILDIIQQDVIYYNDGSNSLTFEQYYQVVGDETYILFISQYGNSENIVMNNPITVG